MYLELDNKGNAAIQSLNDFTKVRRSENNIDRGLEWLFETFEK